ncbi:MAG: hypothetical protein H8E13_12305 [Actinobacteria bacterium]|nr:hypothetical protein [Actinomycetota bacterium]
MPCLGCIKKQQDRERKAKQAKILAEKKRKIHVRKGLSLLKKKLDK